MARRKNCKQHKSLTRRLWLAQRGRCHWCQRPTLLADDMTPANGCRRTFNGDHLVGAVVLGRLHLVASLEHLTPLSVGGTYHPDNLAMACERCNVRRSAAPPLTPAAKAAARRILQRGQR